MYNYFPHPSNARVDGALIELRQELGSAGYGIYWMILELLRDADGYRLKNSPRTIAFAINEPDTSAIEKVTTSYGLFAVDDDGLLFSPWLSDAMEQYDNRKARLQEAGRKGAERRAASIHQATSHPEATLKQPQNKAAALDVTLQDEKRPNPTQATRAGMGALVSQLSQNEEVMTEEAMHEIALQTMAGHAHGYIAHVCWQYHMSVGTYEELVQLTNSANLKSPAYKRFVDLVKRIQRDKFKPDHPDAFFLAKMRQEGAK
ncbi:MAG: DUF4373 domain-containing protein [Bacteroidales bacterium]|nr:DUF4373 domain-containing protein [Bacteroidales bacterium]